MVMHRLFKLTSSVLGRRQASVGTGVYRTRYAEGRTSFVGVYYVVISSHSLEQKIVMLLRTAIGRKELLYFNSKRVPVAKRKKGREGESWLTRY